MNLYIVRIDFHCKSGENINLFHFLSRLVRYLNNTHFYDTSVSELPLSVKVEYPNIATMITNTQIVA
jgi:hypothetical protein